MKGYSGSSSFQFEIERYKNKSTGEVLSPDSIQEISDDYEYSTILLDVSGSTYFEPGRMFGPPEKCYEDEEFTEIISAIGPDNKDWIDLLSSTEIDSIKEMIIDHIRDDFP